MIFTWWPATCVVGTIGVRVPSSVEYDVHTWRCDCVIYRPVVVSKRPHASCSAWTGFITAADRQQLDAFIRRSIHHCGFCSSDSPPFQELLRTSDKQLFGRIIHNQHHLLYNYLPSPPSMASQNYDRRPRTQNRQHPPILATSQTRTFLSASCITTFINILRLLNSFSCCTYHEPLFLVTK